MTSAKEIRAKVRAQERERARLRETAFTKVLDAGSAVAETETVVAAAKATLREKVLAKLEVDCAKLDDRVAEKEIEAGHAVIEAMGGELAALGAEWREGDLRDLTGFQVAQLRRWARRARGAETDAEDGSDDATVTVTTPAGEGVGTDPAPGGGMAGALPANDGVVVGADAAFPVDRAGSAVGTTGAML